MEEKWTINEIKDYLVNKEPSNEVLQYLEKDTRMGVKKLLQQYQNSIVAKKAEEEKFIEMSRFEQQLWQKNIISIVGVDEVGRGPLAGPVVVAAVVLPKDFKLLGLDDSKKVPKKRELFFRYITTHAVEYSIGIVEAAEIDQINILQASKKAMYIAIEKLSSVDYVLIDAVHLEQLRVPSMAIIKGDQKSISIAAASIVAKVTRDQIMADIHNDYPQYGFNKNSGYGTKQHLEAIQQNGLTSYHRRSFLKSYIDRE
ncbi:ribonuclease HII [Gracilibacillus boraciitolerans JCM 21714]|uniref:Ribonuclease HII n=1 Tax=Gracilibacillus boraciitolerans JCM 21714 TaxID=1298598 RepID=W4VFP9_9BACI|nr:ribonuclease HII [Gracilibacillus boraciitolerans]GAE91648.1 ribonuclease HII [Gracilibacillus boraciitolerans JCM 21714]